MVWMWGKTPVRFPFQLGAAEKARKGKEKKGKGFTMGVRLVYRGQDIETNGNRWRQVGIKGFTVSWFHGLVVSRSRGLTVSWSHGLTVGLQWVYGWSTVGVQLGVWVWGWLGGEPQPFRSGNAVSRSPPNPNPPVTWSRSSCVTIITSFAARAGKHRSLSQWERSFSQLPQTYTNTKLRAAASSAALSAVQASNPLSSKIVKL